MRDCVRCMLVHSVHDLVVLYTIVKHEVDQALCGDNVGPSHKFSDIGPSVKFQLYADLLLLPDWRYGFRNSKALYRPQNDRYAALSKLSNIATSRKARKCSAAVRDSLACGSVGPPFVGPLFGRTC